MSTSSEQNRLDELDVYLSPKEWAIQLAQEMREQASEEDFLRAVAKRPYREWPWVKPFFKLIEQTEQRYPVDSREVTYIRNQSNKKQMAELQAPPTCDPKSSETTPQRIDCTEDRTCKVSR